MATFELDPLFLKALGYLRSSNKDSVYHLKALLDDVIAGNSPRKSEVPKVSDPVVKIEIEEKKVFKKSDSSKREAEKRSNEKIKKDISDIFEAPEKKKAKLQIDRPRKPVIEDDDDDEEDAEDETVEEENDRNEDVEEDQEMEDANMEESKELSGSTDVGDFALELGLSCGVCKQMNVSKGNQLVECQECHSLYHQKCHKPFVSDSEINDPRVVWYCSKCSKSLKKMVAKKSSIKTAASSSSTKESNITIKREIKSEEPANIFKRSDSKVSKKSNIKTVTSSSSTKESTITIKREIKSEEPANIFKRSDSKVSSPSGTAPNQPFTGLASYAANLTGRSGNSNRTSQPGISGGRPSNRERSNSMTAAISSTKTSTSGQISKGVNDGASKSSNSSKTTSGQKQALKTSSVDPYYKRMQMMKKKASKK
ncbi:uncharacterized protein [Antedon mediterranea]|uniref:uncharacterized protein n=1 Tax=Antedon mediterranea TaxID=105859 RepID=UPI003AF6DF10